MSISISVNIWPSFHVKELVMSISISVNIGVAAVGLKSISLFLFEVNNPSCSVSILFSKDGGLGTGILPVPREGTFSNTHLFLIKI
jgi:hypothetical protein